MSLKQKVYQEFCKQLTTKINALQQQLVELKEAGANETKSTAGDKHETALAMLQIEETQVRTQLQTALEQQEVLLKIIPEYLHPQITSGTLIKTNKGYFFMSTALGRIIVDGITVFAISPQAPLGKLFYGLKANDTLQFNQTSYQIESIF